MRAELRALASKSPHPAIPARPRKRGSPRSPREKERRPRRTCNSTVQRANKSSYHTGISMFLYMLPPRAPLSLLLDSDPCFIRVSSVAQGPLASLLSGTSVRSVAKEQARAGVPHFLAKPKVRPLPTELQNAPRVAIARVEGSGAGTATARSWYNVLVGSWTALKNSAPGRWFVFGLCPALGLPSSLTRLL